MMTREVQKSNIAPLEFKIALAVLAVSLVLVGMLVGSAIEVASHPSRVETLCDWRYVTASPPHTAGSGLSLRGETITTIEASRCSAEIVWR